MSLSRRDFLKLSGSAAAAGLLPPDPPCLSAAPGEPTGLRTAGAMVTATICPYCSVGCGILVHTKDGKVINTEGDPDHPISEGAPCSKGASLYQLINNPLRLTKPKYRAAGATAWQEVEWDWALDRIAQRVKETRDRTFKTKSKSRLTEKKPDGSSQSVEKEFVVNRTDGILFHNLPGYLPTPGAALIDLKTYIKKHTPKSMDPKSVNWWSNRSKYITSYLKAIYGDSASRENDFGYAWLPKLDEGMDCSWLTLFDRMFQGNFEGFFAWGQNPACSGSNAGKVRKALAQLKWLVNVNLFDNETGSFWKGPGMDPAAVRTEVFLLQAGSSIEKEGSITNSARLAQWRTAAINPIGEARPNAEIINELHFRVKKLYQMEGGKFPAPLRNLTWDYGARDARGKVRKVDIHAVAREINGYYLEDVYDQKAVPPKLVGKKGELCAGFIQLRDDGSTSCGNWLYSQSYTQKEGKMVNMMARRTKGDPTGLGLFPEWAWCWPKTGGSFTTAPRWTRRAGPGTSSGR